MDSTLFDTPFFISGTLFLQPMFAFLYLPLFTNVVVEKFSEGSPRLRFRALLTEGGDPRVHLHRA